MEILYENHISIKKDKLCPFKLGTARATLPAPTNWHENVEFFLVTGGTGAMQYGRDTLPLSKGDIVLVNSGVLHRPYSIEGLDYYFIIVDESFCKENGLDIASVSFVQHLRSRTTEKLFLCVAEAEERYEDDASPLAAARLRLAVLHLLIDLFEHHVTSTDGSERAASLSERYIKEAMGFINEHYTERMTLQMIASFLGVSRCHLSREFKRITGQTVLEYINVLRCKRAELLLSCGKSATVAALDCGFESLSYFSRTYKRLMGSSPSKSRQSSL